MKPISELVEKIVPLQDRLKQLDCERNVIYRALAELKSEYVSEFEGKFIGKNGDRVFLAVVFENTINSVEEVEAFQELDRGDA